MNRRVLLASTFAADIAAPALLSAQKPRPAPSFRAEKCYGIAKAGKADAVGKLRLGGFTPQEDESRPGNMPEEVKTGANADHWRSVVTRLDKFTAQVSTSSPQFDRLSVCPLLVETRSVAGG